MGVFRLIESPKSITTSSVARRIVANHEAYMVSLYSLQKFVLRLHIYYLAENCNAIDWQFSHSFWTLVARNLLWMLLAEDILETFCMGMHPRWFFCSISVRSRSIDQFKLEDSVIFVFFMNLLFSVEVFVLITCRMNVVFYLFLFVTPPHNVID